MSQLVTSFQTVGIKKRASKNVGKLLPLFYPFTDEGDTHGTIIICNFGVFIEWKHCPHTLKV